MLWFVNLSLTSHLNAHYTDINLWHYGRVAPHSYTPVFVLRTRRTDKSRVFINICVCDAVPVNPKGILTCNTDRLMLGKGGAVDFVQHNVSYEDVCREIVSGDGTVAATTIAGASPAAGDDNAVTIATTGASTANFTTTGVSTTGILSTNAADPTITTSANIGTTDEIGSVEGTELTDNHSTNSELEDAPEE